MSIEKVSFEDFLDRLTMRSQNVLKSAGLASFDALSKITFTEYLNIPCNGLKSANEVKDTLAALGHGFKYEEPVLVMPVSVPAEPVKGLRVKNYRTSHGLKPIVKVKKASEVKPNTKVIFNAAWTIEQLCAVAGAINTGAIQCSFFGEGCVLSEYVLSTSSEQYVLEVQQKSNKE